VHFLPLAADGRRHRYRVRSAANVIEEVRWIKGEHAEVKEIMFDDDTFTDTSTCAGRGDSAGHGQARHDLELQC